MRVQGKPRQLESRRKAQPGLKVYATLALESRPVVVGSIGEVVNAYYSGALLVDFGGIEVLYDREAVKVGLLPFDWVYLASERHEIATLYRWA